MMKSQAHGRRILIILVLMSALPTLAGWLLYRNPQWVSSRVNYGHLIHPAMPVARTQFQGLDRFSTKHLKEIEGHWVLLHIVPDSMCTDACQAVLVKTRQLRLMLNKDLLRVRRLVLTAESIPEAVATPWWQAHTYLLRARSTEPDFLASVQTRIGQPVSVGMLFLMDPLGNLMMWYENGFDPYQVKKDLRRLLHVSQVG